MTAPTDGLTVVDKPPGITSHDVVSRMRRIARTRRVGHAGTLDPMATGVLVVAVGRATRLMQYLTLADKEYTATIRLGESSSTDDADGVVIAGAPAESISRDDLIAATQPLTGDIMQIPSSVSAIKVDGRRAYQRVRDGELVDLPPRPVVVSRFDVLSIRPDGQRLDVDVDVACSSGTYIRALARDLGAALGVGGHLTALRRTRVGPFTIEQARTLDELAELDDPVTLPLVDAVRAAMPLRYIDADEASALSFGRTLDPRGQTGTHAAVTADGRVAALLVEQDGRAKPVVVFTAAG